MSNETVYRKADVYVGTSNSNGKKDITIKSRDVDPEQARKAKKSIKRIVIIFILLQFLGPIIAFLISTGAAIGELNAELKENGSSLSGVIGQIINEESGEFSDIMRDFGNAIREEDVKDESVDEELGHYEEFEDDRIKIVPIG